MVFDSKIISKKYHLKTVFWCERGTGMNLGICIGSSCHLKGSKKVAMTFERLISEHGVREKIIIMQHSALATARTEFAST